MTHEGELLEPVDLLCPVCGNKPRRGLTKVNHCQLHGEPYQNFRISCCDINIVRANREGAEEVWKKIAIRPAVTNKTLIEGELIQPKWPSKIYCWKHPENNSLRCRMCSERKGKNLILQLCIAAYNEANTNKTSPSTNRTTLDEATAIPVLDIEDARLLRHTLCLLNSMVIGGEKHSKFSQDQFSQSLDFLHKFHLTAKGKDETP